MSVARKKLLYALQESKTALCPGIRKNYLGKFEVPRRQFLFVKLLVFKFYEQNFSFHFRS